jgi:sulfatase maturation enzyme AslB (radical SAM superfamily)
MVDALIHAKLTNIYIGFTTNGTVFNQNLLEKLNVFKHVDIGISIETADKLNDFVRTGSNTSEILQNTQLFLKHRKQGHVYVTIRTVPSALSVHSIDSLFNWCIENQVDVMSNMLFRPEHLRINNLPQDIKQRLLDKFSSWPYSNKDITGTNDRDPTYFKEHIDHEMRAIVKMLEQPADPALTAKLYETLEQWGWFNDLDIRNYFFTAQQHN